MLTMLARSVFLRKPRVAAGPLFTVVNLGSTTGSTGTTLVMSGLTIPAGSLICVGATDQVGQAGTTGGFTDNAGSGYVDIAAMTFGSGSARTVARAAYKLNASGVTSITLTRVLSGRPAAMSALYITGASTVNGPTAMSTARSAGAACDSGLASGDSSVWVGFLSWNGVTADGFIQDSTNAAFVTPPVRAGIGTSAPGAQIAGGTVIADFASLSYQPSLSVSTRDWIDSLMGFSA